MRTIRDLGSLSWRLSPSVPHFWEFAPFATLDDWPEAEPIPAKVPGSVQANLRAAGVLPDAAWRTVKRMHDRRRPDLLINIHNWANKWIDGLLCNSEVLMENIRERLPSQRQFLKRWRLQTHADYLNESGNGATPPEVKTRSNSAAAARTVAAMTAITSGMTTILSSETPKRRSSRARKPELESVIFPERISLPMTIIAARVVVASLISRSPRPA